MKSSIDVFKLIVQDTDNAGVVYSYLKDIVRPPYDYSDLLRWQWAQSVSALDKLIHDLVRVGMIESFLGKREQTPKFLTFSLNFNVHLQMTQNPDLASIYFEKEIIQKHGFLSFQDPKNIGEALSNIWGENQKWYKIAQHMSLNEEFTKTKLRNISIRRNQIVHEGDYSNSLLQRQPITDSDVTEVLDFVKVLGEAIYDMVKI
jgi:hypothetical protein